MQGKSQRIGHLFLLIVVLTWGPNFGIVKSAYQDLSPILFAALRFTFSGILLLLITLFREKEIRIHRKDIGRILIVGGFGLGLYQVLWSIGLDLTSASNSALILSLQPLMGALYVDLVKKEGLGKRQYGGMLFALGGAVLVILKPTAQLHFSFDTLLGDLLTFIGCICSAICFTIWARPLLKNYTPLRLISCCMILCALILWMVALFSGQPIAFTQIGKKAWWSMGYAVLFSGILGHVLWYEGIDRIGATKTLVYLYFTPIGAVIFNGLVMGERIFPQQVLGGGLILWGVHRSLRN
jgi:drug/metabolite transporter (DMT)-like permease